jgi:hypothetical protein
MSPMLALAGGDKDETVAAKLPLSLRHLRAFRVIVIVSIVALSAR